jgi:hypothetical protein
MSVQTGTGAQPTSSVMGIRIKWPRCGVDHPPPPSAEVKYIYIYLYFPAVPVMACYKVTFTFISRSRYEDI